MKNKSLWMAFVAFVLVASSCAKDPVTTTPEEVQPTEAEFFEAAQLNARTQNYTVQMMTSTLLATVTQPELYGGNALPAGLASAINCPTTEWLDCNTNNENCQKMRLTFGDVANPCTIGAGIDLGGEIMLDRNDNQNVADARWCQANYLLFNEAHVQGCDIDVIHADPNANYSYSAYHNNAFTGGLADHTIHYNSRNLRLYSNPLCDNSTAYSTGDDVTFRAYAPNNWRLKVSDPTSGMYSVIDPLDGQHFMRISTENNFMDGDDLDFNNILNREFRINIRKSSYNSKRTTVWVYDSNGNVMPNCDFKVETSSDLVFAPFDCKNITEGKMKLYDFSDRLKMTIDYGVGAPGTGDWDQCDAWVEICTYNVHNGDLISCEVTKCLPF